ncbi:MAG: ParA family protein [Lawsonibacter sp.]|nr:ParA family protein [Lawsonibacter sp.]
MTQIITVTNQKGGVGKTTTASALVCGLNQRGARVLGVDLDPQGNLGFTLGLDIGSGRTVYDMLKGACSIEEAIAATDYGDVIPSDIMLSAAEVEFTAPRREFLLNQKLSAVRDSYDFVIIDTPPALNLLTVNAYVASTGLIVPMEAEVLSLVGITQLQETIETVRASFNPDLKVLGILLNKFNPRLTLSKDILELAENVAQQLDSRVFQAKIHRGVGVAMAPAHGQSVLTYQPSSRPAQDFQSIVDAVAGERFPRPKGLKTKYYSQFFN